MAYALESITLKGYKSIRTLEQFPLAPLNVLIGANGSGKSNFISAFNLLHQIVSEHLQTFVGQQGGAENLLYFGKKNTDQIEISLKFGKNGYRAVLIPAANDTLIFGDEQIQIQSQRINQQPFTHSLGTGHRESLLFQESNKTDFVVRALKNWQIYHFHDTSPNAKVKQTANLNDNRFLRPDASNLSAFLYFLQKRHPAHYKKIVATIQLVAPFFKDFNLHPARLNSTKIRLEWQAHGSDAYFDANMLSDGTLRFICLATLLLQPNLPATILLDEPELGLHPYAIGLLASLIRSAATRSQIIIATQSTTLVNQFSPADIIVVDFENNQSVFHRLNETELSIWLDAYSLGDLWEKNLLGGRPK